MTKYNIISKQRHPKLILERWIWTWVCNKDDKKFKTDFQTAFGGDQSEKKIAVSFYIGP